MADPRLSGVCFHRVFVAAIDDSIPRDDPGMAKLSLVQKLMHRKEPSVEDWDEVAQLCPRALGAAPTERQRRGCVFGLSAVVFEGMTQESDAAAARREKGEEEVGPALCSRGDLGPFPCLESGCHAHGLAIGCRHLAKGGACDKTFGDVWQRPQGWAARLRVWEACPHACDLCDEPQEAERRPIMGSCDA